MKNEVQIYFSSSQHGGNNNNQAVSAHLLSSVLHRDGKLPGGEDCVPGEQCKPVFRDGL